MELDAYIRALIRRWYIPLILVGLAVVGVWLYHSATRTNKAVATVAVLQAWSPPPGEFVPAQVGFDVIDESRELTERVAARLNDGTTADQIEGKLSVGIRTGLSRSPLYSVSASDKDKDRAILIANLAVEEGRKLFGEMNRPNSRDVRAAFQAELDRAQAEVAAAREGLNQFLADNDAYALPARLDQQVALVSQLRMSTHSLNQVGAAAPGDGPSLAAARAELQRLAALEPEYDRLTFEAKLAQDAVSRLEAKKSDLAVAGPRAEGFLAEVKAQLAEAGERLASAQDAVGRFQQTNTVSDPPAAIQSQLALVNQLVVSEAGKSASATATATAVQQALATEEGELQRLVGLEPEYNRLNGDLQKAETQLGLLEQRVLDIIVGQTLPAEAQVKVLDTAKIQSSLWWAMITYALGVTLAIFLSLTAVYLLAFFERVPPSVQELEREFGQPVIVRVPRVTGLEGG